MQADRPRTWLSTPAFLGGLVAVALAFAQGPRSTPVTGLAPRGPHGPSVSAGQDAPAQPALHRVATTPGGFAARHWEPSGCPMAITEGALTDRPVGRPDSSAAARVFAPRPPLRVLLCTWLI